MKSSMRSWLSWLKVRAAKAKRKKRRRRTNWRTEKEERKVEKKKKKKKKKKSEIKSCGWWFPQYVFNYENAMKTEFWKLKTHLGVFSFQNSSLKNQRIEWWKQKPNTLLSCGTHIFWVMGDGNTKTKQPLRYHIMKRMMMVLKYYFSPSCINNITFYFITIYNLNNYIYIYIFFFFSFLRKLYKRPNIYTIF